MPTTHAATFGRRSPPSTSSIPARQPSYRPEPDFTSGSHDARVANPLARFLYRAFLWLPDEQAPGFGAVCLTLVRQVVLPFAVMFGPVVAFAVAFRGVSLNALNPAVTTTGQVGAAVLYAFGCIALVQELCRYSFVRRALDPVRSIMIFGAAVISLIVLVDHDRPYTMAWSIAAQIGASLAMLYARRQWAYRYVILAAIIACQTVIDVDAPRFGARHDAPNAASPTAQVTPPQSSLTNFETPDTPVVEPPNAGGMQTWAKLYSDARVDSNETQHMLGLTTWRVQYTTAASSDQIAAFYANVAIQCGFKEDQGFLGLHTFRRADSSDTFSYDIFPQKTGSRVFFQARVFEQGRGS